MVVGTLPSSSGMTVLVLEKADDEAPCLLRNCHSSHIQQAGLTLAGLGLLSLPGLGLHSLVGLAGEDSIL